MASALTTSGWPEAARLSTTSCRCSSRSCIAGSTAMPPSGWNPCACVTQRSSSASELGSMTRSGQRPARPDAAVRQLEALVRRHRLTDEDGRRLAVLAQLIAHDRAAPTKVRDPRAVIDDHLADSLVALECEPVRSARAIADLGAGAGFPGLPLAIALPESHV